MHNCLKFVLNTSGKFFVLVFFSRELRFFLSLWILHWLHLRYFLLFYFLKNIHSGFQSVLPHVVYVKLCKLRSCESIIGSSNQRSVCPSSYVNIWCVDIGSQCILIIILKIDIHGELILATIFWHFNWFFLMKLIILPIFHLMISIFEMSQN